MLRRAVELGVNFIDTADSYGPEVSEKLIAEALHPVPRRPGHRHQGRASSARARDGGRPTAGPSTCRRRARAACAGCALDQIPLYQFHRPDPRCRSRSRSARWSSCKERGQDPPHRAVATSTSEQLRAGAALTPIVSVQNRYNLADRASDADARRSASRSGSRSCRGRRSRTSSGIPVCARSPPRHGATARQVVLAWLLGPLAGDAADPRHRLGRAPRGERRRRRASAQRPTKFAITDERRLTPPLRKSSPRIFAVCSNERSPRRDPDGHGLPCPGTYRPDATGGVGSASISS